MPFGCRKLALTTKRREKNWEKSFSLFLFGTDMCVILNMNGSVGQSFGRFFNIFLPSNFAVPSCHYWILSGLDSGNDVKIHFPISSDKIANKRPMIGITECRWHTRQLPTFESKPTPFTHKLHRVWRIEKLNWIFFFLLKLKMNKKKFCRNIYSQNIGA